MDKNKIKFYERRMMELNKRILKSTRNLENFVNKVED